MPVIEFCVFFAACGDAVVGGADCWAAESVFDAFLEPVIECHWQFVWGEIHVSSLSASAAFSSVAEAPAGEDRFGFLGEVWFGLLLFWLLLFWLVVHVCSCNALRGAGRLSVPLSL